MEQMNAGQPVDAHSQWCANQNWRIALGVTAFCAVELFLS
jgi:hypothetical protein